MIRENKLSNFVERQMTHKPITADIRLTNYCNARCKYCNVIRNTDYMKIDDFIMYAKRLLDLGVLGFKLTGGEPTLSPHFEKVVAWLEENNIPYGLNTNLIRRVVCEPVWLKVSIDAGTREEFMALRGVDKLDDVLLNVDSFCKRKKMDGLRTKIGVQSVATSKENVLSFYHAVKGLDVDYIYIRPWEMCGGGGKVSRADVESWMDGIKDERINISFKFDLKDYLPNSCFGHWSAITVRWDGMVQYCCNRIYDIVGHVMDDDILEKKAAYCVDMKKCDIPCRLSGVNKYLEDRKIESDIFFV